MSLCLFLILNAINFSYEIEKRDWRLYLRYFYSIIALIISVTYILKLINVHYTYHLSRILAIISLIPLPRFLRGEIKEIEKSTVLRYFLNIFPFLILLSVSYELVFMVLFYNLIQLWIKLSPINDSYKFEEISTSPRMSTEIQEKQSGINPSINYKNMKETSEIQSNCEGKNSGYFDSDKKENISQNVGENVRKNDEIKINSSDISNNNINKNFKKEEFKDIKSLKIIWLIDVFVYLFFIYASFFCNGNASSLSGFSLKTVYRFMEVYYPKIMASLIGIKMFLPFLLVSLAYYSICLKNKFSPIDGFLTAMVLGTSLNIIFFFYVKNDGSWLEIGMSISYYLISISFILSQLLLHWIVRIIFLFNKFNMERTMNSEQVEKTIKEMNKIEALDIA